MPFNAKARKAQLKTVRIPFDSEEIKLVYRPAEWTQKASMQIQRLKGEKQTDYILDLLTRLIAEWDITDGEDGPAMPITRETLMDFDQGVINALVDGITGDISPKSRTLEQ